MDLQAIELKAKKSKSLLEDDRFKETVQDLREMQFRIFADSSAEEVEKREDAHAILRALTEIERLLNANVANNFQPFSSRNGCHKFIVR